jgi:hypothetical protein
LIVKERHIDFLNIPLIVNENRKNVQKDNYLIKNIENRIKFIKNPKNQCFGKFNYEKSSLSKALFDLKYNNSYKIYKRLSETKYLKIKQALIDNISNSHRQTITTYPLINTNKHKDEKSNTLTNRNVNTANTFNSTFFSKTTNNFINDEISKCKT